MNICENEILYLLKWALVVYYVAEVREFNSKVHLFLN